MSVHEDLYWMRHCLNYVPHLVTAFERDDLTLYEDAIKEYGDDSLKIEDYNGCPALYHYGRGRRTWNEGLSKFWKIFEHLKSEREGRHA